MSMQCGRGGEEHTEKLPPHRISLDCVSKYGYPKCYGAAGIGDHACTCDTLTKTQHAKCVAEAKASHRARKGRPCHDCAFRKGSPEADMIEKIAAQESPFHCHQGMPVDARGGTPKLDCYVPKTVKGEPVDYPICAGWLRARRKLG